MIFDSKSDKKAPPTGFFLNSIFFSLEKRFSDSYQFRMNPWALSRPRWWPIEWYVCRRCIGWQRMKAITTSLFWPCSFIVIMKVSYGLVLSLLLSVILSLSRMKQRQKANGQNHLAAWTVMVTINQNIRQSYIH